MTITFGAFVPQGWRMELLDIADPVDKYETMTRCAREAEAAGYDSIWLFDHFHTVPRTSLETTFECWTAMAGLARDTGRVKLGQMCTCNGYRPPALLAKMASCIDVMSRGRVIMGIGAGWHEEEFRAYGYEFPEVSVRLRQLEDALAIMRAMWTEERATYEGRHHRVAGAVNEPKPVQSHVPLWVAGGGEKVTLKLAARYGDACNVGGSPSDVRHKLEVFRRHCEAAGRDYDAMVRSVNFSPIVASGSEASRIVSDVARRTGRSEREVRYLHSPSTPEQAAQRYLEYVEAGANYFIYGPPHVAEEGVLTRFASEVMPLVVQGAPV
jgi:F420-dependent oxidoreductase-like protein